MRKLNKGHTIKICYIVQKYSELLNSSQSHHNINFPNQKKHQEILVELLYKLNQN